MTNAQTVDIALNGTTEQKRANHIAIMSLPFSDRQRISMTLHARKIREGDESH